jgi:hypothetical protein
MAFEKRIQEGFRMGLSEGIDLMMALAGVLIAVGGQLGRNIELKSAVSLALRGKLPLRYTKAILKSKLAGRPVLPKDIWTLKALVSMGMDATVYREKIKKMWGRYPLSVYGSTETVIMATQLWDHGAMTFLPHTNFLEFIPEGECRRWLADPTYRPHVFTLDEVKAGENYGIVATNFYGGALVRYFIGDIIKITSLRNEKLDVNTPQMVFYSRLDSIIDIDGVVIMPEGYVWQAVEDSGLVYRDWVVKQENDGKHRLHFYIESKNGMPLDVGQAAMAISKELRAINPYYSTLEDAGDVVLEVTQLPSGAFRSYAAKQRATGADLAHLKPPHVNPSDEIISLLVNPLSKSLIQKDSSA